MKKFIILIFILTLLTGLNTQAAINQPVEFQQTDEQWGSELYSITNNRSQTIANSGCGPTSMAMVLNYYIDESITPLQTSIYALSNNHRTRRKGTSWEYFEAMAKEYDLDFYQTTSSAEALSWMETKSDPLIICSMGPGLWTTDGHFIVLWDVVDGIAYINDPNSTDEERVQNSFNRLARQCRQYFCFNKTPILSINFNLRYLLSFHYYKPMV